MTDMIEGMARELEKQPGAGGKWDDLSNDDKKDFIETMQKAFTALKDSGYAIVPVEPTFDMLNAAIDVDSFKLGDISPLGFRITPQMLFYQCYQAMIAKAQEPEEVQSEPATPAYKGDK